jgi:hypothetical protein
MNNTWILRIDSGKASDFRKLCVDGFIFLADGR